jgi:hypothetical protein
MGHRWAEGMLAVGLLALPAFSGAAEDDLAVVKKAVGSEKPAPAGDETARAGARKPRSGAEPQWLKLRIEDRGEKKARVSVNLPLELVRALEGEGEDWPLEWPHHGKGQKVRLGDVLRALRAGQEFVTIEDEEATVRIWVE